MAGVLNNMLLSVLAKASLTTFKPNTTALPEKGTLPKDVNSRNETAIGGVISYTNVGGPGDQKICSIRSYWIC